MSGSTARSRAARRCTDRAAGEHRARDARRVQSCDEKRRKIAQERNRARYRIRFTSKEFTTMPLVSMRQLLDHAAEHGYGLPAFNVNNLEQVQAIMAAANEVNAPVIMQASAGARKYAGEAFLRHLIEAAVESYPHIPVVMHQDHGQSPAVCMAAIRSRLHQRDDGRLARSRRQDRRVVRVQRRRVAQGRGVGAFDRRHGRSGTGRARFAGNHEGRQGRRPRRGRHDDARATADRRRAGRRLREADAVRRAGDRDRHVARRVQVLEEAHGRYPRRSTASRKSTSAFRTRTW